MGKPLPGLLSEVPVQTAEQRAEVLATRSLHRAYDGAPPTIPHPVDGKSTFECLACHEKGAIVVRQACSRHEPRASRQLHAVPCGCGRPAVAATTASRVELVRRADRVEQRRARVAGFTSQNPASTVMRTECGACHGVAGELALRTSHPMQANVSAREWRESCPHCHLPSALERETPRPMSDPHE